MDSLTQIVLGAAVGEAALGKKVGNRAMMWGAIGGTIPDLDVFANFFTDEMTAMAFHRGISHSLFFAVSAPLILGWLVHRFYSSNFYRRRGWRIGISLFWLLLLGFTVNGVAYATGGVFKPGLLAGTLAVATLILWALRRDYWKRELNTIEGGYWGWVSLFFWSIFTHPLLDSCTPYGTQLFQPFSDYRVALNNIAVADPAYTFPFLICLLIALFLTRASKWRVIFNWLGIAISSAYLLFTFYNKYQVNQVFETCLERDHIHYHRYMTTPTILNNILWQGVAEGDTAYYYGNYSLFDAEPTIPKFEVLPKHHHLLDGHQHDRDVEILKWFSNGYYNLIERDSGMVQLNDLRYGAFNGRFEKHTDYISRFELRLEDGVMVAKQSREAPDFNNETLTAFWNRIMGIRPNY